MKRHNGRERKQSSVSEDTRTDPQLGTVSDRGHRGAVTENRCQHTFDKLDALLVGFNFKQTDHRNQQTTTH